MLTKFKEDLAEGEGSEHKFIEYVKKRFQFIDKIPGKFKYYDVIGVKSNGEIKTFEVKNDKAFSTTGNVAIEISCNGVASGISTSTSTYWVIDLDDEGFWMCDTNKLYNCIFLHGEHEFTLMNGGDGNRARFALIPFSSFKEIFSKIVL